MIHQRFVLQLLKNFNARCRSCWAGDVNSNAGKELDSLTFIAESIQLIDKPTHFFSGGPFYIDLIYCNKPKIVSEYGVDHSLFQTFHHNLISAKVSADMPLPGSYSREVWEYEIANVERIQKSQTYHLMRLLIQSNVAIGTLHG